MRVETRAGKIECFKAALEGKTLMIVTAPPPTPPTKVTIEIHQYQANHEVGIELRREDGAPWTRLTVCIPDAPQLGEREVWIKTWNPNESSAAAMLASGLLVDSGERFVCGDYGCKAQKWYLPAAPAAPKMLMRLEP